jgi:hypothetical protein
MLALGHHGLCLRSLGRRLRSNRGSSVAEFAISLPLLIVLVVGIFDFGGAFNQKQELNNAMREGARFGAAQPTNDLCTSCAPPPSVDAIRVLVDSYMLAAHLNDCGLSQTTSVSASGPPWIYNASISCPGTLTLTIVRGYPQCYLPTATTPVVNIPCTQVSISYPYQWHFNSVIQLLAPGSNYGLSNISTTATAANMD